MLSEWAEHGRNAEPPALAGVALASYRPRALYQRSAPAPPACCRAGKEMQLLRAKALECVSLVGLAVGKERFG